MYVSFFFSFLVIFSTVFASDLDPAIDFYNDIADICNPTQKELRTLQYKLLHTHRPILERMKDTAFIPKECKFFSDNPKEVSEYRKFFFRSHASNRENCIIIYSSFNERYPLGTKRLLNAIENSDYVGHLYYRIGGWPNIKNGDLCLAHVPFAFKACFFKEIQQKGYKKILWLDCSILPSPDISLNTIFDMIDRIGFFIQAGDHTIGVYMNEDSARAFGVTLEETKNIITCSAAIIGLDLTKPKAVSLLDSWYEAAHHPFAFFSARSDQNALSILIYKMGLTLDLIPRKLLGSLEHPHGSLFIMDRPYVKDERN